MQTDGLRLWSIVEIRFRCFFHVRAEFFPSLALSEDVLGEAFRGITALGFLRNFKDLFAYVDGIHQ